MKHRKVAGVMTPAERVVSITADTRYKEIARLLAEHRISSVPVLDAKSRVVGIVSEADLLAKESGIGAQPAPLLGTRRDHQARAKAASSTAAGLMSSPAVTIGPEQDVVRAARLMQDRRLKRLPVVDADGVLAGLVSRRDLLGVFLRSDEEIREEVVEDIILGALWVDPTALEIEVAEGVVRLRGDVETKSLAAVIDSAVRRADGVVDVVNELGFARDDREDKVPGSPYHGVFEVRKRI